MKVADIQKQIKQVQTKANPAPGELVELYEDVLKLIAKSSTDFEAKNLALAALGDQSALTEADQSVPLPADLVSK